MSLLFILAFGLAIFFSFWNGFSDAANAISTIVATRVLKPFYAVILAAFGNFFGLLFGSAVAVTIGTGIIKTSFIDYRLLVAALLGAMIFDVTTWFWGLPISETQVLIGGLLGAGLVAGGTQAIQSQEVLQKVIIPMIFSPIIAFFFTIFFLVLILRLFRRFETKKINPYFRYLQIFSSWFFSVNHGANDGQKIIGLLTSLLVQQKIIQSFKTPFWVILVVQLTIALGTLLGGWRIVKTMAKGITHLKPYQGFCAESGAALVLFFCSLLGFPISTTHAITGSIMGVGATKRWRAVNWKTSRNILIGWLLSIPLSGLLAGIIYFLIIKI